MVNYIYNKMTDFFTVKLNYYLYNLSLTVAGMFPVLAGPEPSLVVVSQLFKGGEFSHCFASSQVFPQLDKCGEWRLEVLEGLEVLGTKTLPDYKVRGRLTMFVISMSCQVDYNDH